MEATPSVKSAKKQVECPHCHSFKTTSVSKRYLLRVVGLSSIMLGMATAIFLIGIPFIIVGIATFIVSRFFKETGEMRCKNCGNAFTV